MKQNSASDRRIVIIGGSIGGLFAGLSLLRDGWDVEIFDSATQLDGRGAGITTHQPLLDALDALGIATGDQPGLRIKQRKTFAHDGSELGCLEFEQTVMSWGRLYRVLCDAFPTERYHRGCCFESCVQADHSITAVFSDGRRERAVLLVAADGIRSAVRQQVQPTVQPEYAGYMAWRGMVSEKVCSAAGLSDVFPHFTFCLPPGEQCLAYPVAGDDPSTLSKRLCNLVWYRPADAQLALPRLLTDIDGRNNGSSIAPNRIRPAVIADMRKDSRQLLSPQHAAVVDNIKQPFIQPIYDVMSPRMNEHRVVFIGDAAFTARPHPGMGVTKAAEDALALAQSLADDRNIDAALDDFNRLRLPINMLIVNHARELGACLEPVPGSDRNLQTSDIHKDADEVMRETASDTFLV